MTKSDIDNHNERALKIQRNARSCVDHKGLCIQKVLYLSYYVSTEKITQTRVSSVGPSFSHLSKDISTQTAIPKRRRNSQQFANCRCDQRVAM
jgi:hypothetical protein